MTRLNRGENQTIDRINDLVEKCKSEPIGSDLYKESFDALLKIFKPMILSICSKWSKYFNDTNHRIKPFDELVADAEYWFMVYTINKYTIDGDATFNNFIKKHIDQRIRYIYETELKHYTRTIYPDPSKNDMTDEVDVLERVIYQYSSEARNSSNNISNNSINIIMADARNEVAHKIMDMVNKSVLFTDREKMVFNGIICEGITHDEMGKRLNVSRSRVSQILKKLKIKLYNYMNNNEELWDLIYKADIDFKEE